MGISEMTVMSYFLMVMAFVFGVAAVVMYFALDIRRCWGIVRARHYVLPGKDMTSAAFKNTRQTEGEATQRLVPEQTQVLLPFEEMPLPETVTLVQDIVMMDVGNYINS